MALFKEEAIITPPSRGAGKEPGQDGNVAALTYLPLCGGFLFIYISKVLMEPRDVAFMKEALLEAEKAFALGEVPVGAVIVKDGKIVGRGHNTRETENDISGHAEINAIKEAEKVLGKWSLEHCSLYVTLEPCIMCGGAIRQSRLSTIVFGAKDEEEGAVVSKHHVFDGDNGLQNVHYGVLEKECSDIIKSFFAKRRNEKK